MDRLGCQMDHNVKCAAVGVAQPPIPICGWLVVQLGSGCTAEGWPEQGSTVCGVQRRKSAGASAAAARAVLCCVAVGMWWCAYCGRASCAAGSQQRTRLFLADSWRLRFLPLIGASAGGTGFDGSCSSIASGRRRGIGCVPFCAGQAGFSCLGSIVSLLKFTLRLRQSGVVQRCSCLQRRSTVRLQAARFCVVLSCAGLSLLHAPSLSSVVRGARRFSLVCGSSLVYSVAASASPGRQAHACCVGRGRVCAGTGAGTSCRVQVFSFFLCFVHSGFGFCRHAQQQPHSASQAVHVSTCG